METDLLKAAREEEVRLDAVLRGVAARLELVRAFIRDYVATQTPPPPMSAAVISQSRVIHRRPRSGSMAAVVCRATEEFLEKLGHRAESSVIADEMKRLNIEIPGLKPTSVVASYLSNSDKFDNVRGQGYGLKKWSETHVITMTPREVLRRPVRLLDLGPDGQSSDTQNESQEGEPESTPA